MFEYICERKHVLTRTTYTKAMGYNRGKDLRKTQTMNMLCSLPRFAVETHVVAVTAVVDGIFFFVVIVVVAVWCFISF